MNNDIKMNETEVKYAVGVKRKRQVKKRKSNKKKKENLRNNILSYIRFLSYAHT